MGNDVFIKIRGKLQARPHEILTLGHVAEIIAPEGFLEQISCIPVHQIEGKTKDIIIISVMELINVIKQKFPELSVQHIGKTEANIEIIEENQQEKKPSVFFVVLVSMFLFIGSGMAIMNFHADVDMIKVHRQIYFLLTGDREEYPLWLQIPYSLGLGLGMMIFFNSVFGKKINRDPSPMEVRFFKYQQGINQFRISQREQAEKERHSSDRLRQNLTYDHRPKEKEE